MKTLIKTLAILTLFASCNNTDTLSSEKEMDQAVIDANQFAESNFDCLNSIELTLGGQAVELFDFFRTTISFADEIHITKPAGYYCPCEEDCPIHDEFVSSLTESLEQTEYSYLFDMLTDCTNFFGPGLYHDDFCEEDYFALETIMRTYIDTLFAVNLVDSEESKLMNDFITDTFEDYKSVDYCHYANEWQLLPKETSSKGLMSGILITSIPGILVERTDYLLSLDEWTANQRFVGYALLGLARAFVGGAYSAYSKGDARHHPDAGMMMLGDAAKTAAFGI